MDRLRERNGSGAGIPRPVEQGRSAQVLSNREIPVGDRGFGRTSTEHLTDIFTGVIAGANPRTSNKIVNDFMLIKNMNFFEHI